MIIRMNKDDILSKVFLFDLQPVGSLQSFHIKLFLSGLNLPEEIQPSHPFNLIIRNSIQQGHVPLNLYKETEDI